MKAHMDLNVAALKPHPSNRKIEVKAEKFRQLVASITAHGVLQDLLVRPRPESFGGYEIIAGERRWRAATEVGLEVVPCKVAELTDREALEILLIDNLERDDLDPVEEAEGVRALIEQVGMKPGEIASRLSRSLEWVTTRQGLLDLPAEAIAAVKRPKDDERHLHLGTVQLILALEIEDRQRAVQMVLHPDLQVGTLRPQQAADMIKRTIVEPKRARKEWEYSRDRLVKAWKARLKPLLPKSMRGDLVVRALTWEEIPNAQQGRSVEDAVPVAEMTPEAPSGMLWLHLAVRHGLAVSLVPEENEMSSKALVDSRVVRAGEASWSEPQRRKIGEENGEPIWEEVPARGAWLVSRDGKGKVTTTPAEKPAAAAAASPAPSPAAEAGTTLSRAKAAVEGEPEYPEQVDGADDVVVLGSVATVQPWTIDGGPVTALRMWAQRMRESMESQNVLSRTDPLTNEEKAWLPPWVEECGFYRDPAGCESLVEISQWIEGLKR